MKYVGLTTSKMVDQRLEWLADYRVLYDDRIFAVLEGLILGAALAIRHPEYLQAFVQAACAAQDEELEDLPDGHAWAEHLDVADALVEENPLSGHPDGTQPLTDLTDGGP